MSNKMNLIFEPADLDQASPATVSRCGMIYMEPKMLGWRTLMASYSKLLLQKILPEQHELLEELMDWLIPACLSFIQYQCKQFIVTSELHMFFVSASMCYIVFSSKASAMSVTGCCEKKILKQLHESYLCYI